MIGRCDNATRVIGHADDVYKSKYSHDHDQHQHQHIPSNDQVLDRLSFDDPVRPNDPPVSIREYQGHGKRMGIVCMGYVSGNRHSFLGDGSAITQRKE